ncbi:MAG: response regulator [Asticcacaulis sp.]|uniref:response regulator n=1 Tax=Asticcacaulis sp. TaxID=1872648 RepID=UPI0039E4DBFF
MPQNLANAAYDTVETRMQSISNAFKAAPLILAVDDDRVTRMTLTAMLEELGYQVIEAENGQQALDILMQRHFEIDTILLDREMPVMDGLQLVSRMKETRELKSMPVIMQTGSDRPDQVKQGIDAGVFYYLTKPVNADVLKSVLLAAIRDSQQKRLLASELNKHRTSFNLIESSAFRLKTIAEAENLSVFLANCFPAPERAIAGLAELLVNAVEHGNLEIGYATKSQLIAQGTWAAEIESRLAMPQFSQRHVDVFYKRAPEGFYVVIRDQGRGFDWKNYLFIDPARAMDNHGRGIAQANALSFDRLGYNEAGNEVTAFCSQEKSLDW